MGWECEACERILGTQRRAAEYRTIMPWPWQTGPAAVSRATCFGQIALTTSRKFERHGFRLPLQIGGHLLPEHIRL
jgi:hypothetical protein